MIQELKELFEELRLILEAENETNWIRGVEIVCNILEDDTSKPQLEKFNEVKRVYVSMNGGAGSFSDYYIHRDNFDERLASNKKLDKIRDRLWEILSN